jgi:hypothetical protein
MTTAMKCNGGVYRVEDNGSVYIYDTYDELVEDYSIIGVITPSISLKFAVVKKG